MRRLPNLGQRSVLPTLVKAWERAGLSGFLENRSMKAAALIHTHRARRRWATVFGSALLLAACATHEYPQEHTYKFYRGPARPAAELATLALGDAMAVRINERQITHSDYTHVEFLPGTYKLEWFCGYGVSVMIEPSGFAGREAAADVELKPAHRYSLRCSRTTGPNYQTFQWVSDDTEGRLVRGTRRP